MQNDHQPPGLRRLIDAIVFDASFDTNDNPAMYMMINYLRINILLLAVELETLEYILPSFKSCSSKKESSKLHDVLEGKFQRCKKIRKKKK